MRWFSAVSEAPVLADAIGDCAERIHEDMAPAAVSLAVTFVSAHHEAEFERVPALVDEKMGPVMVIGCSAGGVIGAGREVENRPGVAMTAADLRGVQIVPFHIDNESVLPDGDAAPSEWESVVEVEARNRPLFLLLADPFSVRGDRLLAGLDFAFPQSPKLGGLASGAARPEGNALFLGRDVHRWGVAGLAMYGNIEVDTVVAQGCRPIGRPMRITACNGSILTELDGAPAMEALRETFAGLDERDKALAQHSLFMGVVMDPFNEDPQIGDFLIRNLAGFDARRGALAVAEKLEEGQLAQFHLRDAETSARDLDELLTRYATGNRVEDYDSGALLFSCLGRGSYLYGRADHDTDMFRDRVGELPLGGFFCNGEIGQVGGSTYLHSYTSSFGIFHPKRDG